MEILFQKSFYQVWQYMLRQAAHDVQNLDRSLFKDPSLGGILQKIAAKYEVEIARFEGEIAATRRTEEREGRDAWGDRCTIKTTWLDVSIPFVGEAESFRSAPSRWGTPSHRVTIGQHALTITIPDDERADAAIEQFKTVVGDNLRLLQAEYQQAKPQLQQAIQQAVDRRKAEIAAEDTRDKGRSFRVIN
ncbi:hypothetical protein [Bradyrhizobium sp. SZCCHNR1020]|uniref:hypothetical protein n=1 Tax=Bradyrhizobium sp. SZCCHNR1020 TaxID=3057343 RepID=UPI002916363B|nr:hypothetical protein [Bradyrhizobium sp. SZCCHNR1020]